MKNLNRRIDRTSLNKYRNHLNKAFKPDRNPQYYEYLQTGPLNKNLNRIEHPSKGLTKRIGISKKGF